jgi:hypothetical protein
MEPMQSVGKESRRGNLLTSILIAELANRGLNRELTAKETSLAEETVQSIDRLETWWK